MKAKLIKKNDGYYHLDDPCGIIAFYSERRPEHNHYKLSLKNCQDIERGYDLYELAKENYHKFWSVVDESEMLDHTFGYVEGFQKALELMGDKKFTEEELKWLNEAVQEKCYNDQSMNTSVINKLKSIQQNEWEVEVEMICPHPSDTYRCGIQYGCDEDGCNHPNQVPYLDADGCLILKRV